MQFIGGHADDNNSNLLRHDSALQMLVGKAAPGTPKATLASQPKMGRGPRGGGVKIDSRRLPRMGERAVRW